MEGERGRGSRSELRFLVLPMIPSEWHHAMVSFLGSSFTLHLVLFSHSQSSPYIFQCVDAGCPCACGFSTVTCTRRSYKENAQYLRHVPFSYVATGLR